MLVSDRLMEPFLDGDTTFLHGVTFAGHPVSTAVALANLDIFEKEDLLGNVKANEAHFRSALEELRDLPIVGDVRAPGTSTGSNWSRTRPPRRPSTATSPSASCAASCPERSTTRA